MSIDTLGAGTGHSSQNLLHASEKTGDFIAQSGYRYTVDTRNGPVVVTPPAIGVFDIVDSRGNAHVNNITVDFVSAGIPFHGGANNSILNQRTEHALYRYINADIGFTLER